MKETSHTLSFSLHTVATWSLSQLEHCRKHTARHSYPPSRKRNPLWRCSVIHLEDDSVSQGSLRRLWRAKSIIQQKCSQKK